MARLRAVGRLLVGGRLLGQRLSAIHLIQAHNEPSAKGEINQPHRDLHGHGLLPGFIVGDVPLAAFDANAKLFLGHPQERPDGFECLHGTHYQRRWFISQPAPLIIKNQRA